MTQVGASLWNRAQSYIAKVSAEIPFNNEIVPKKKEVVKIVNNAEPQPSSVRRHGAGGFSPIHHFVDTRGSNDSNHRKNAPGKNPKS